MHMSKWWRVNFDFKKRIDFSSWMHSIPEAYQWHKMTTQPLWHAHWNKDFLYPGLYKGFTIPLL